MTNSRFLFHLRIVAVVHVLIILFVAGWSGVRGCTRDRPEIVVPVEFMVNVAREPAAVERFLPPEPVVEEPVPAPEPEPKPLPKPEPKPEPKRKPIKVSRERVIKKLDEHEPQKTRLSEEEIRKRLALNATPGTRDILPPSEEALGYEIVRRALYQVWSQPGSSEVGDSVAGAVLRLDSTGRILSAELNRPSGNAVMDASVRQALLAVGRIEGLSDEFLKRHREITVTFKVE